MTKAKTKTKARQWIKIIEKMKLEHEAIEKEMKNPDDWDEFIDVGMALENLEFELQSLIDS